MQDPPEDAQWLQITPQATAAELQNMHRMRYLIHKRIKVTVSFDRISDTN